MNTTQIIETARTNGGGTFHLTGGTLGDMQWRNAEFTEGFYVAVKGGVENVPDFAFDERFVERVVWARHRLSGLALGLWQDDAGNWSVDETDWFDADQEGEALGAGEAWNQRAIWDIKAGREILV